MGAVTEAPTSATSPIPRPRQPRLLGRARAKEHALLTWLITCKQTSPTRSKVRTTRNGSRTCAVDSLVEIIHDLLVHSRQVGPHALAQYHKVAAARTHFSTTRKATKQEACIQAGMALHLGMEVEDHLEEELHLMEEYRLMEEPHQEACQEAEEVDQDHHHQVSQVCQQVHSQARYSP